MSKLIKGLLLMCVLLVASCKPRTDWTVYLSKERKSPYGTYLARNSVPLFFKGIPIEDLPLGQRLEAVSQFGHPKTKTLLILSGQYFGITDSEGYALLSFIQQGNEVVLFCDHYDYTLMKFFHRSVNRPYEEAIEKPKKPAVRWVTLASDTNRRYNSDGKELGQYFIPYHDDTDTVADSAAVSDTTATFTFGQSPGADSSVALADTTTPPVVAADTEQAPAVPDDLSATTDSMENDSVIYYYVDTLGYVEGKPNMLRFSIGEGHFTINTSPGVLSNYFLLQPGNEAYLWNIWKGLPTGISKVYWLDFFNREPRDSWSFGDMMSALGLSEAFLTLLFSLLLYILFQKRRQRIIPVIPPLKNESVTFVETIGRLYYNRGNNTNIAEKMIQQFLEWVRATYYLPTNAINPEFAQQLSHKSGMDPADCLKMVDFIANVRLSTNNLPEAYLLELYELIQKFYKLKK
ncbi:MAG: hypothetical protein EBZ77_01450 [Chitinophagia bacterium]|nr:hypothetical protein [Chitinophagia bacterium]